MLRSQTDTLESRFQIPVCRCVHPEGAFQFFLLLPHQPAQSSQPKPHAGLQATQCTEKEEQNGLSHPLQGAFPCASGFQHQKGTVLPAAPSRFCLCFPSAPTWGSSSHQKLAGWGRDSNFAVVTAGRTPVLGMDYRDGELCSLCKCCGLGW